jgi:predicted nucleic acid-binding protein
LVLDSEGLWALARKDSKAARTAIDASWKAGIIVVISAAVLAETLHGGPEDARANQIINNISVAPVTAEVGRVAARLKRECGLTGVAATIDAIVVATSMSLGGGVILTSDPRDINRLGSVVPGLRIRAIAVD